MIQLYSDNLTTAIVIMMPLSVQRFAMPIMQEYSPQTLAWYPPHITLMIPFVPVDELETACDTLRIVCNQQTPFSITLEGYGYFPTIAYMKLRKANAVQGLFRAIYERFPDYPPYEGKYGNTLNPHVTVAHLEADSESIPLPRYDPLAFIVDRLHVVYGSQEASLPFVTYDVIRLGNA